MATPSQVLTLQDMEESMPTLRLRLKNKAEALGAQMAHESVFERMFETTRNWANYIFSDLNDASECFELDECTTLNNKRRVNDMFDSMERKINKQRKSVLDELDNLNKQQQEDMITFWSAVNEFFNDLFTFLQNMFTCILEKIRAGFRIVRDAVRGIFKTVLDFLKIIFKSEHMKQ